MKHSLVFALALAACGGEKSSAPVTAAPPETGAVEDTAVVVEETPEVCGTKLGDVFCNHELMGYARVGITTGLASSAEYGLHRLTDVLALSSAKYVYVFASAYW